MKQKAKRRHRRPGAPPTIGQRRIHALLLRRYGSVYEASRRAVPRLSYTTIRSVLLREAPGRLSHSTVLSMRSLGVPDAWMPIKEED